MKSYIVSIPVNKSERNEVETKIFGQVFATEEELNNVAQSLLTKRPDLNMSATIIRLDDFIEWLNNTDDDDIRLHELIADSWFGYAYISDEVLSDDSTVGNLISKLAKYPKNFRITTEQNTEFVHITEINDRVILSTHFPVGTCNRTGTPVYPTPVLTYSAFSPELDEDLTDLEWTPYDLFTSLERVDEGLRIILENIKLDKLRIPELKNIQKLCQFYGYTFDIIDGKAENLRKEK